MFATTDMDFLYEFQILELFTKIEKHILILEWFNELYEEIYKIND